MSTTATPLLRLPEQAQGANPATWGTTFLNEGLAKIEQAIAGVETINFTSISRTLATINFGDGTGDEAANRVLVLSGSPGANSTLTIPGQQSWYLVDNTIAHDVTLKPSGMGASVPANTQAIVYCDGTNATVFVINDMAGKSVKNVADPVNPTAAANKQWAEGLVGGLSGLDEILDAAAAAEAAATQAAAAQAAAEAAAIQAASFDPAQFARKDSGQSSNIDAAWTFLTNIALTSVDIIRNGVLQIRITSRLTVAPGSSSVSLPASPSDGDRVVLSFSGDYVSNAATILRNGNNINGVAEDLTISTINGTEKVQLEYDGTAASWSAV